jgi:hypothetical protein
MATRTINCFSNLVDCVLVRRDGGTSSFSGKSERQAFADSPAAAGYQHTFFLKSSLSLPWVRCCLLAGRSFLVVPQKETLRRTFCGLLAWTICELLVVSGSPEHSPQDQRSHRNDLKLCCGVAQRTVEDLACPMTPLPSYRHDHAVDPEAMLNPKSGSREHLVAWIDMHIVLLGTIIEILDPTGNRIVSFADRDPVSDNITRMRHPVASDHKWIWFCGQLLLRRAGSRRLSIPGIERRLLRISNGLPTA